MMINGSKALLDVMAERDRQIEVEGFTPERDDTYTTGSMAMAAAAYCGHAHGGPKISKSLWAWTGWAETWFKPRNPRADLVRAGALVLAEIERLDRAAANHDFLAGKQACDLSGDGSCEACQ